MALNILLMAENTHHLINRMLSNFGEPTSDEPEINMDELDKLNREYFDNELNDVNNTNAKIPEKNDGPNTFNNFFGIFSKISSFFTKENASSVSEDTAKKENSLSTDNKIGIGAFNLVNEIKKYISDPLGFIIVLLGSLFAYIYFAGELICQILGLFCPCYYLYTLLHFRSSQKSKKVRSFIKYIIMYGHLEIISSILKIFGFYFFHLKILIIISLLYMVGYRQEWLEKTYDTIIFYDKIMIGLFYSAINKFWNEYSNIKNNLIVEKKDFKNK